MNNTFIGLGGKGFEKACNIYQQLVVNKLKKIKNGTENLEYVITRHEDVK